MATLTSGFPQSISRALSRPHFPGARNRVASPVAAGLPAWMRFGGSFSDRTEDLIAGFWTPGLLEQLQEPLTRYHE